MKKVIKDGEPCDHNGCCNHVTHPCEICGRTCCQGDVTIDTESANVVLRILKIMGQDKEMKE